MKSRLEEWQRTVPALQNLVNLRAQHYTGLMTTIDKSLAEVDTGLADAQSRQSRLTNTIANISGDNYRVNLASKEELSVLNSPQSHEKAGTVETVSNNFHTEHVPGDTQAVTLEDYTTQVDIIKAGQQEVTAILETLSQSRNEVSALHSAVRRSYRGYDVPLQALKEKLRGISEKLDKTLEEQSALIRTMAVEELQRRKKLLQDYLVTARYELAKNYDLASAANR
jgi:hypothetical protein